MMIEGLLEWIIRTAFGTLPRGPSDLSRWWTQTGVVTKVFGLCVLLIVILVVSMIAVALMAMAGFDPFGIWDADPS